LILWVITPQIPAKLPEWEVILEAKDMANERLPQRSMIKVGKLFTMHRSLVAARFGAVNEEKRLEVLDQLRMLFAASQASPEDSPREREGPVPPKTYDDTEGFAGL
jgi:AraC-like DNA-binding protein